MGNVSVNGMHVDIEKDDKMIKSTVKWCIKTKNFIFLHRLVLRYGDEVYIHLLLALQDTVAFKDESLCLELLKQIEEWELENIVTTNLPCFFLDIIHQGMRRVCEYLIKHYIVDVNEKNVSKKAMMSLDKRQFHVSNVEIESLVYHEKYITPLHAAVMNRQVSIARLLIDHGARIVIDRESSGIMDGLFVKQPMIYAIQNFDQEMVQLFLDYNVLNIAPEFNRDYLETAIDYCSLKIFQLLINAGITLDSSFTLCIFIERCYREGIFGRFFHDRQVIDDFYESFFLLFKAHEHLLDTAETISSHSNQETGCFLLDSAMYVRDFNIIKAAIRAGATKCRGSSYSDEPHAPHVKRFVEIELRELYGTFLASFLF